MGPVPFDTVCVVGAGYVGTQIGLLCAVRGRSVWMVDISDEALRRAAQSSEQMLEHWLDPNETTSTERVLVLSRLHFTTDISEGAPRADLVIEAVPELLEAKREVFRQLDQICPDRTVLASNSSSIRISLIENATQRIDRVLNMHFYAPVWQYTMADVMRGTTTSDETMDQARQFIRDIGLTPLVVRKESTGFVFNRVWRAVKRECLHLVDEGVATHEDVDRAWMIFTGMSNGPFGGMDNIGLDVVRDIEMVYYRESGHESDAPPKLLTDMIERGELGVKAGRGFYTHPNPAYQDPSWLKGGND